MDKENGKLCFCSSIGPVYTCKEDDKPALRLAQGMLISLNLATAIELSKALGVNRSTVTRNFNIYESHGMAGFVNNIHAPWRAQQNMKDNGQNRYWYDHL